MKKYAVFLLHTGSRRGTWFYVFGTEAECRLWLAKNAQNNDARYSLLKRHKTLEEAKSSAASLHQAALDDQSRTYDVTLRYARGSIPAFIGNQAIVAQWTTNASDHTEEMFLTEDAGRFYIRSRDKIRHSYQDEQKAKRVFDDYAATKLK